MDDIRDVNTIEYERQRAEAIKKSGHYIEVTVLIGPNEEQRSDGSGSNLPVVHVDVHNCTGEAIACAYATIKGLKDFFEKQYPLECAISNLTVKCEPMGISDSMTYEDKDDDEEEEKK